MREAVSAFVDTGYIQEGRNGVLSLVSVGRTSACLAASLGGQLPLHLITFLSKSNDKGAGQEAPAVVAFLHACLESTRPCLDAHKGFELVRSVPEWENMLSDLLLIAKLFSTLLEMNESKQSGQSAKMQAEGRKA